MLKEIPGYVFPSKNVRELRKYFSLNIINNYLGVIVATFHVKKCVNCMQKILNKILLQKKNTSMSNQKRNNVNFVQ